MSTMKKLKNAKDRLAQAEQEIPGAYESAYTGQVNDRLDKIGGMNDTGVTDAALSEAFREYKNRVQGNAANSAAAALGTAQGLSGGYGTDWTKSVVNQTAADQTASAGTALAALRSKALQQWQNELAGNADMVSTLLGQDSMERSAAAQDTANAQSWRNYLYGRLGQARQEGEDAKNNIWNIIKGIGSVAKAGYDGYMGYTQIKLANEVAGQQQAWEAFDAGDPERARQILKTYDLDESMVEGKLHSPAEPGEYDESGSDLPEGGQPGRGTDDPDAGGHGYRYCGQLAGTERCGQGKAGLSTVGDGCRGQVRQRHGRTEPFADGGHRHGEHGLL